ncbi:hypothetical protein RBI13_18625 [Alcaligenaceae bacterium A4P071]|nr:hypothetical protein [Alcaligenaceae bacterium A4P071]
MSTSTVRLRDRQGVVHDAQCSVQITDPTGDPNIRLSRIYTLPNGGFVIERLDGSLFGLHGHQYWLVTE